MSAVVTPPLKKALLSVPADALALWDFDGRLSSRGPAPFWLVPISEKWEWVDDGVWGRQGLRIRPGGGFRIPRTRLGPLNIHGPGREVTVAAWIKRESDSPWQALAGLWDESRSKRQYFLFLNARSRSVRGASNRVPCANRIHGHVSDSGGASPGDLCCITYATGASEIPLRRWVCVAMSFGDGSVRVYVDGRLDACPESNPYPMAHSIFDGGTDGADFTLGINSVRREWSNPFGGVFGGLAVYARALTDDEHRGLAAAPPHGEAARAGQSANTIDPSSAKSPGAAASNR